MERRNDGFRVWLLLGLIVCCPAPLNAVVLIEYDIESFPNDGRTDYAPTLDGELFEIPEPASLTLLAFGVALLKHNKR